MMKKETNILGLFQKLFFNFNARQMKDATLAFKKHLDDGGKMLVAMGGPCPPLNWVLLLPR